jgi:TP901 family phage tail tape measure protein
MTDVGRITAIIDGDIGPLGAKLAQARSQATASVAGIEQSVGRGMGTGIANSLGLSSMVNPAMLAASGAVAVGAAIMGSVQAASEWQSSMAGVSKTTGLAGADLKLLSKDLLDMSTRMPAAAGEIANVAQVAGSLGIAKSEIAGFTEVAIQMGVGFEMSAEAAATSGAKILTAYKLDTTKENMLALGNVVNAMGDSFAATEPQVLDFINRAGFLNTTMGQTIPQIAALGTTMISAGMDADVAATGIKSFLNMATSESSKKGGLDNWAKLLNVSVDQLKANLEGDFNATLVDTADQIAAMEDPVERFQTAVALAGTEGAPALLKLAGQQDNLRKALGMTNEEWEHGQSLQKTYTAQSETFNAQMQIMGNVLNLAGVELGTVFLPALTSGVEILADLTMGAIETGRAIYGVIDAWNQWVAVGVGDFAQQEATYETTNKGHYELIGDDAVWIADQIAGDMANGISENESLQNAGEEAIQAGIDAGVFKDAGESAGEDFAKAFADSQKSWLEANANYYASGFAQLAEYDSEGKLLAKRGAWQNLTEGDSSTKGYGGLFGRGSGVRVAQDDGIDFALRYNTTKFETQVSLWVDGQQMANGTGYGSQEEAINDLFNQAGFPLSDVTSLTLQNRGGDAAKAGLEVSMLEFLDFKMEDSRIPEAAQGYADEFSKGLEEIDWANLPGLLESKKKLEDSMLWMLPTEQAAFSGMLDEQIQKYTDTLLAGIVDSDKFLKQELEQIGKESKDAFSDGFLDSGERGALLGLEPELRALQAAFPERFKELGGESILLMIDAIKAGDLPGAMATLGEEAAEGYKSALFGALQSGGESRSLAEIISSGGNGIADVSAWMENEFGPKLNSEMEAMNKLWDSGLTDNRKIVEEDLGLLKSTFEDHGDWFKDWQQDLIELYRAGDITTNQFLDKWGEYAKKADESAKNAAEVVKSANALFYNEIRDDTKTWHDYINSEGGFVGPTEDWYAMKIDAQARLQEIANLKAEFEAMGGTSPVGVGSIANIRIDADTSPALDKKTTLEEEIAKANPILSLKCDTEVAMGEVNKLLTYIIQANPVMSVQVSVSAHADEIRAIVDSEISAALASL